MSAAVIARNPVIRGFTPDPSIVQVGDWYYLATSTFEWFPGVRIHRSRDLVHWEVVGHALDERNAFDLAGVPDSGGVWAPSLTFADGQFWLAYSVIRSMDGDDKDLDNYLITAADVTGPWSAPVALGSRGIDFSFFHDHDGRHWLVGVRWDHRPGRDRFGGIVLEEYLPEARRVSGEPRVIYRQESLVEGPNLYRLNGWYYLTLAEGGTGWNHGITVARSRRLEGPFERDPEPFVLSRRDQVGDRLQKAGHGELAPLPDGSWALVHLASRPIVHGGARFSTLGRETCLQLVHFDDEGWLRLTGDPHGSEEVSVPLPPHPVAVPAERDDFDNPRLDRTRWATLRRPAAIDLTSRPGWARLHGGHSWASVFEQTMIAQRVTEPFAVVETLIEARPASSRQAAGLVAWYDRHAWIWLQLTFDEENGRHLRVRQRDIHTTSETPAFPAPNGPVRMRLRIDSDIARFEVAAETGEWTAVPGDFPAWKLSDDHGQALRFTGLFVGVRAEDLDGDGFTADVDYVTARFAGSAL